MNGSSDENLNRLSLCSRSVEVTWMYVFSSEWKPSQEEWNMALTVISASDPTYVTRRVLSYHKGVQSPAEFDHRLHTDTKAFVIARLLLQQSFLCGVRNYMLLQNKFPSVLTKIATSGDPEFFSRPIPKDVLQILYTDEGKPVLSANKVEQWCSSPSPEGARPFNYNSSIAHSDEAVVLATNAEGGYWNEDAAEHGGTVIIGVDLMPVQLTPAAPITESRVDEFFKFFTEVCTDAEWAWIRSAPFCQDQVASPSELVKSDFHKGDEECVWEQNAENEFNRLRLDGGDSAGYWKLKRFLIIWTLKEAYFKAIGTGISSSMKSINFVISRDDVWADSFFSESVSSVRNAEGRVDKAEVNIYINGKHRDDWIFRLTQLVRQNDMCENQKRCKNVDKSRVFVVACAIGPQSDACKSFRAYLPTATKRETNKFTQKLPTFKLSFCSHLCPSVVIANARKIFEGK